MIDSSPPNQQAFYEQVWSLVRQAPRGELLFLALATCYCNDIYREAAARGIEVTAVEVEVTGDFGGPGDPARNVVYWAKVMGKADVAELEALARHTDTVAEIQNTLRVGAPLKLEKIEVESLPSQ